MAIDTQMPRVPSAKSAVADASVRLRQAQMILAQAETKQGLRAVGLQTTHSFSAAQVATGQTLAAVEYEPDNISAAAPATRIVRDDRIELSVLDALKEVLPQGLARGGVTCVKGSTFASLSLLVQASREGAWIAIIGMPNLNYAAVHEVGIDTTKIVVIPDAQEKTPEVIAALIEGIDVVFLGPTVSLTRPEQRALTARARERGAHLIVQHAWEGARTYIQVERGQWSGIDNGLGRLNDCSYGLTRMDAAGRSLRCTIRNVDGQVPAVSRRRTWHTAQNPHMARSLHESHQTHVKRLPGQGVELSAEIVRLERVG